MCKGNIREKAEMLFDVVLGPKAKEQGELRVSWKSGRIIRVFK
jgi:hypothetical protein